jgi:hypothetical protein
MHSFPPAFCVRAKPNTEPSHRGHRNPIGTEKRHSVRVSCAGRELVEGAEQVTIVVRRLRTAAGWPGKPSHDCRPSGLSRRTRRRAAKCSIQGRGHTRLLGNRPCLLSC